MGCATLGGQTFAFLHDVVTGELEGQSSSPYSSPVYTCDEGKYLIGAIWEAQRRGTHLRLKDIDLICRARFAQDEQGEQLLGVNLKEGSKTEDLTTYAKCAVGTFVDRFRTKKKSEVGITTIEFGCVRDEVEFVPVRK